MSKLKILPRPIEKQAIRGHLHECLLGRQTRPRSHPHDPRPNLQHLIATNPVKSMANPTAITNNRLFSILNVSATDEQDGASESHSTALKSFISSGRCNFPTSLAKQIQVNDIDLCALQDVRQQYL